MITKALKLLCAFSFLLLCITLPARATPERDAQWKKLLAQAAKHGGKETVSGHSASYVFAGPGGMDVTFTHSLDNKVRLVCAGQMRANINVCWNWDTQTCLYSTRVNASSPWGFSTIVPDFNKLPPETQQWGAVLMRICGVKMPHMLTKAAVKKPRETDLAGTFIKAVIGEDFLGMTPAN